MRQAVTAAALVLFWAPWAEAQTEVSHSVERYGFVLEEDGRLVAMGRNITFDENKIERNIYFGESQAEQVEPYPDAPMCPSHDDRAYHTLWDAERGCHYDHHHGSDPHELDDIFGTDLFTEMGGEVSHPWQTFSDATGTENHLKHAGYFWHVVRDADCSIERHDTCLTDFRLAVHQHPVLDPSVRFHSAVFEGRTLDPATGQVGYTRVPGMWVDFGNLVIDGELAVDEGTIVVGTHRQHSTDPVSQGIWYGASTASYEPDGRGRLRRGFLTISTSVHDLWVYTNPDGSQGEFVCYPDARCTANATLTRPHLVAVNGHAGRYARDIVDPDGDGVIDFNGYFDRYGVPQSDGVCTEASLDCVPVVIENISIDLNYYCDAACAQRYTEHDIYFGGQTANWSQPVASWGGPDPEPEPEPDVCPDGSEGRPVTIEDADGRVTAMLWECHLE